MSCVRVALVAIARDEGAYLANWIAHHLYFGFDEFHIWVNRTTDSTNALLKKINREIRCVYLYQGDAEFDRSNVSGRNFQIRAYNLTLEKLRGSDVTHIMCLDIDELWTPMHFTGSIKSILINNSADVISFPWHIDRAERNKLPFSDPFSESILVEKDRHVKSVARISERLLGCFIHSFMVRDGRFSTETGEQFLSDASHEILPSDYNSLRPYSVGTSFILHTVHRSSVEYIATLSRGRPSLSLPTSIKTNRGGFRENRADVSFRITEDDLSKYRDFISKVVASFDIEFEIEAARASVIKRANLVAELIAQDSSIELKARRAISGIDINQPNFPVYSGRKYHIDGFRFCGGEFHIEGWVDGDISKIRKPALFIQGDFFDCRVAHAERPDVASFFDIDGFRGGFIISSHTEPNRDIKISDVELFF